MRRHLLDRPAPDDQAARLRAFLRIARDQRVSPATRSLQRQPRTERAQPLVHALRIERGRTA